LSPLQLTHSRICTTPSPNITHCNFVPPPPPCSGGGGGTHGRGVTSETARVREAQRERVVDVAPRGKRLVGDRNADSLTLTHGAPLATRAPETRARGAPQPRRHAAGQEPWLQRGSLDPGRQFRAEMYATQRAKVEPRDPLALPVRPPKQYTDHQTPKGTYVAKVPV
jgi:hypothetical protein